MKKGVIFDLDGVLVSTDEFHYQSWQRLCDEERFSFFDHTFNHQFRGVARFKCTEILLTAAGKEPTKQLVHEIAERKNQYFVELLENVTDHELLPGSKQMLGDLQKRGVKIAVASNSRNAKMIIEKVGIANYLDVIVDGYDLKNSKPDPEPFLLAAQRIGLPPGECVVIEDAVSGIQAAQAAGMASLGIGEKEYLPNAPVLVKNLSEITADELLNLTKIQ